MKSRHRHLFHRPLFQVLEERLAPAAVENTNPAGPKSLQKAIIDCNELPTGEICIIDFDIPGPGPHTIKPLGQLPDIAWDKTIIDGWSEGGPGYTGPPLIVLNGADAGSASGLVITSDDSTIKGLVINDFTKNGIEILDGENNVVEGNYIGTDSAGAAAVPNKKGVFIYSGTTNNTVRGNVISGNVSYGVHIADNNTSLNRLIGNYIGTDKTGSVAVPNNFGIRIDAYASENIVGGGGANEWNLISGNGGHGIVIQSASKNEIIGNRIGTDIGLNPLPNEGDGVQIYENQSNDPADENPVGRVEPFLGNIIAYNEGVGVRVNAGVRNAIRGNSIHDNEGEGIILENNGNNSNSQAAPALTSAKIAGADIIITGTLVSTASTTFTLDFYSNVQCDSTGFGEGETYLDDWSVTTLPDGTGTFTAIFPSNGLLDKFITATATNPLGDTSEFSNCQVAVIKGATVTTTEDDGPGSLRQAIIATNNDNTLYLDTIMFDIDGAGVHTIKPLSPLPVIANAVIIDGYSQPGSQPNTQAIGNNAILKIEIVGSLAGADAYGLKFASASGSTVKGLVINRFDGNGIYLCLCDSVLTGMVIEGNFIGTDITGTIALGNGFGIFLDGGSGNRIGGSVPAARNVISGNIEVGVQLTGTDANVIAGNYIGTDLTGTADLGNGTDGIYFGSTYGNTIGGLGIASRNVISGNGTYGIRMVGVLTKDNDIQGNYIGLNVHGSVAIGNSLSGVRIDLAPNNVIGGTTTSARNVISGNGHYGIHIEGSEGSHVTGNEVQGNYIGTDAGGTVARGNGRSGVWVNYGSMNTIGGTLVGARNVISGGLDTGVIITHSTFNEVQGNYIGTDYTGTAALGNANGGVYSHTSTNNLIGGTVAGSRNVISGNAGSGITIETTQATDNVIQGNYIGTDASGTSALGNGDHGIHFYAVLNNVVGGTTPQARNVISGNGAKGISIVGSAGIVVEGNYIGTDASGMLPLGNEYGIGFQAATNNTIGGNTTGARNLISGNAKSGAYLDSNSNSNHFRGNYIGLARDGDAVIGNGWTCAPNEPYCDGITIVSSSFNEIGGTSVGDRNVLSGNGNGGDGSGVSIYHLLSKGNVVQGNYIGTDATGTFPQGNRAYGVAILQNASENRIGGTTPQARNIISASITGGGVYFGNSTLNLVQGNYIGTDWTGTLSLGNTINGVVLSNALGNTIGGTGAGAGNLIAYNGQAGIRILSDTNNSIRRNSIFANSGVGIDLGNDGVTENDNAPDSDSGPNNLQNFPVITSAVSFASFTTVRVKLNSTPNTNFFIEIFSSRVCDPSGFGEGEKFLYETLETTNGSGDYDEVIVFTGLPAGHGYLTATATDQLGGNTSEFSRCQLIRFSQPLDADPTPPPNPLPGPPAPIVGPRPSYTTPSELSDGRGAYDHFLVLVTASEETESDPKPKFIRRPSPDRGIDGWTEEVIASPASA